MSGIVRGGKNLYSIPVGIIMLETRFPRIRGDAGNAATWPFPVMYRIVPGANPGTIVRKLNSKEWLEPFVQAALELQERGVRVITTNCGFLVLFQKELQERLAIPILTSSLLQVPWVAALLPRGRSVGILTIEAASLTNDHLRAAGIGPDVPITILGMEEVGGYFSGQILEDKLELDIERCAREHEEAAHLLIERDPNIGAIVLECTNMPPYADRIRRSTGLPVYDLTTLVYWATSGLGLEDP